MTTPEGGVTTMYDTHDIRTDPRFDPTVCVSCGGLFGCEHCPGGWRPSAEEEADELDPSLPNLERRFAAALLLAASGEDVSKGIVALALDVLAGELAA